MGTSQSKEPKSAPQQQEAVCEDCKIETQKPLPGTDAQSSEGGDCHDLYQKVDRCMREHRHQVTQCIPEWEAFRECHNNQGK